MGEDFQEDHRLQYYAIMALSFFYHIVAAILLLNLLIAMMSDTYTGVFKQAVVRTNFYKIEQTIACNQPYGRLIGMLAFFIFFFCASIHLLVVFFQFLWYCVFGDRWLFDVGCIETWRWIYDDFWSKDNLCYCCIKRGKHKRNDVSELMLARSISKQKTVELCKLNDIAPSQCDLCVIDNDNQSRQRCLFCCIKKRGKSKKLQSEIDEIVTLKTQRQSIRRSRRMKSMKQQSVGIEDDESNEDAVDEKYEAKLKDANDDEKEPMIDREVIDSFTDIDIDDALDVLFKDYKTNDKKMRRRELERNRRMNKVQKQFQGWRRTKSCCNRLSNWYKNWQFIDTSTFCPNCFVGSPSNSIQEYGKIDDFIKSVEKQFKYVIKHSDRTSLRRSLRDSILCQRCFYPLDVNRFHAERKTRFQVTVEITSTYFFLCFVVDSIANYCFAIWIDWIDSTKSKRIWIGRSIFMECRTNKTFSRYS